MLLSWLLLIALAAPWIWSLVGPSFDNRVEISYSEFRAQLSDGNVQRVTVSGDRIRGELSAPAEYAAESSDSTSYSKFVTYLPPFRDKELMSLLETRGVDIVVDPQQDIAWWSVLLNLLPLLLIVGVGYLLWRGMQARGQGVLSALSMRKSRAKPYDREQEGTTFDDVAGVQGAKGELREVIEFLRDPDQFQRLGGEMPKGVLLVGPPGTGKTLLARAVAGEADVPFLSITGSDFMEMFVGIGASRVRDLFDEAKKAAPSIIFIDELDSIGRRRGAGLGGGHDEREQTLNQLLSEMDGFEANKGVIVMAATNRPDILDRALLRPGRFDRRITVDLPSKQDRQAILEIHSRNKPLGSDVDLERIARGTPGFSGADLENLLNEAALLAARRGKDAIERKDIEEARDKVTMGLERENLALTEDECKFLAYHEAGHSLVAALLPHADPIHKVTIVPRGKAMGVTQQLPKSERYIYPKEYMLDRLAVMLGGRAAENLVFSTSTSGAENDLKQATQLARKMVLDWGMSKKLGHLAFGGRSENVFLGEEIAQGREYSDTTAREIDQEIKIILKDAFERASNVLENRRVALDRVADALIEREEIPGDDVLELIEKT
jgi:cell division protease FtsH